MIFLFLRHGYCCARDCEDPRLFLSMPQTGSHKSDKVVKMSRNLVCVTCIENVDSVLKMSRGAVAEHYQIGKQKVCNLVTRKAFISVVDCWPVL